MPGLNEAGRYFSALAGAVLGQKASVRLGVAPNAAPHFGALLDPPPERRARQLPDRDRQFAHGPFEDIDRRASWSTAARVPVVD